MTRWLGLATALVVFFVHLPAKDGKFLFYDDLRFVRDNPHLDGIGNPARFFTDLDVATSPDATTEDIYRPLRTLTFATITKLFGRDSATPFHVVAILLHALAAGLLFALLRQAGADPWPAAFGAALFGLHPVTVEATAWVCSLGDVMCGVFVLGAVLAYARGRLVLAYLAFVVALFSKEHAVVVPGLWLAWDWFLRPERVRGRAWWQGAVPGLAVAIGFLLFRGMVVGANMSQLEEGYGVATMLAGLGWYAATLLFPFGPTFNARVQPPAPFSLPVGIGVLVLAGLVLGALRGPRRSRLGFVWFLMALVPVSNLFVTLKIPTADRFLYIPLMGLGFVGAAVVQRAWPYAAKAAPAALLVLAALTVARIGDWRNDENLIKAGMRVDPRSKMLIWADAARLGKQAVRDLQTGNLAMGMAYAQGARDRYDTYLRNAHPIEQAKARTEVGDLMYTVAETLIRLAPQQDWRRAYSDAMQSYALAFELQTAGVGRIVAADVRHVARRLVDLAVKLAEPRSPSLAGTLQRGLEAAAWLDRHGEDVRLDVAKLRLIGAITIRAHDEESTARARVEFNAVLGILDAIDAEKKGIWTTYMRAQAVFYRSILRDHDLSRPGLEQAYALYMQGARETRGIPHVRCLFYAARACSTIGRFFKDVKWAEKGIDVLRSVSEEIQRARIRLPDSMVEEGKTLLQDARRALEEAKKK